ncbi:MAG: sulfite exporter TauE/SafE family protein [Acidobacteria bacterium]|nr:sulfite exporter TauE/SafE family protein [Acidobacteriota bacterium]
MNNELLPLLCAAILLVAFLYSAVGHAGASGYIAVMTLFGLADKTIRPAALVLNVLVAALTTWQFRRAGHFSWRLFWPFALGSIPLAFVGGYLTIPTKGFKILVGVVLLFSAIRFWWKPRETETTQMPAESLSIAVGGGLGLLSGLTGTGGGIFLTPVLLLKRWATTKTAAGVSALFILCNSLSGLLGNISNTRQLPFFAVPLAASALAGGAFGSYLGSQRFAPEAIKRLLAVVLTIAGLKLLFA